jgi:hypothetical protein
VDHLIEYVFHALPEQGASLDVLDEALELGSLLPLLLGNLLALPLLDLLLGAVPELGTGVVLKAHITLAARVECVLVVELVTLGGHQDQGDLLELFFGSDLKEPLWGADLKRTGLTLDCTLAKETVSVLLKQTIMP